MKRFALAPAISALLLIISCSSSESADSGVNFCAPPLTYEGNEQHIGAGCTKGGDECRRYQSESLLSCAIDLDPEGSTFCIKIGCSNHESCGTNACCTGREGNPVKACVPKACLVELTEPCPPIPGTGGDAGMTPDAMSTDT